MRFNAGLMALILVFGSASATTITVHPTYTYDSVANTLTVAFANMSQVALGYSQNATIIFQGITFYNATYDGNLNAISQTGSLKIVAPGSSYPAHQDVFVSIGAANQVINNVTFVSPSMPQANAKITCAVGGATTTNALFNFTVICPPKWNYSAVITPSWESAVSLINTTYGANITVKNLTKINKNVTIQGGGSYVFAPANLVVNAEQLNETSVIQYYNSQIGPNCIQVSNLTDMNGNIISRYCSMLTGNVMPPFIAICGSPDYRDQVGWTNCADQLLSNANTSAQQYHSQAAYCQNRLSNATTNLASCQATEAANVQYGSTSIYISVALIVIVVGAQIYFNLEKAKNRSKSQYGK